MKARFADTFYYIAALNPNDAAHERTVELRRSLRGGIVTTAWVLTEVANALAELPLHSPPHSLRANLFHCFHDERHE